MQKRKIILFAPSSYFVRGWVSVFAAALLFMAYMAGFSDTSKFLIILLAFFWGGELFLRGAILELKQFYIGFNAYAAVSGGAAFLFAVLNNLHETPLFPVSGAGALLPFIFIAANFIKYFELKHIGSSKKFIESLDGFISKSVFKVQDNGETKKIFVSEAEIGDILLIKNGERVALDCKIVKGSTIVDESLLTGNVTLAAKQSGDMLFAGSVNKGTAVQAEALSLKNSSRIARILEEVKKSENKKMIFPSLLESYALNVFLFFLILALIQFGVGAVLEKDKILYWLLVSLFIMVLSGPVTYMAAVLIPVWFCVRNGKKSDIYIQNVPALEILRDSDIIYIDKTGTLTTGRLEVAGAYAADGVSEEDVLKAAYTAQSGADNIFACALKEYGRKHKFTAHKLSSVELHPSFGTVVKEGKNTIIAGRKVWLEDKGIEGLPSCEDTKRTVFYVAKNGKYIGAVYFKDRLRANAKTTIGFLKGLGKKICLLSGDNEGAVSAAAKAAGIGEYCAAMYPQDKAAKIAASSNMGERTVMLGDGFNDILALLQAGAGVAFSSASNVFSSWVDIIIKDRDFAAFRRVFELEKSRREVIKQNIYISVFSGVFMFWRVFTECDILSWYDLVLIMFLTVLIIAVNSARIKHG